MRLKYIIFRVAPFEVPVAWPADLGLTHKQVARSGYLGEPVSAGFCMPGVWQAHGESVSLGLKAREEADTKLLRKFFDRAAEETTAGASNGCGCVEEKTAALSSLEGKILTVDLEHIRAPWRAAAAGAEFPR